MLIELGNATPKNSVDGRPAVTEMYFPEADDQGLGGYSHKNGGIDHNDLRDHLVDSAVYAQGQTQLPDHEILVSILHPDGSWANHIDPSDLRSRPLWVAVRPDPLTPKGRAKDIEKVLSDYWEVPIGKPETVERDFWTRNGEPGVGPDIYTQAGLPPLTALFTNVGRVQQANNHGGGQVGATGQASASSATTLTTTTTTSSTTQWNGYRLYATVSATVMVWGNVVSCTSGANAVFTVDRWYAAATPGGAAGSTPSATGTYMLADGGNLSAWFCGLTTSAYTPAATDTSIPSEYSTAGGGLLRKICPYALTSGTSPMTYTLTPVFTANGSDSLPSTIQGCGFFTGMVIGSANTMKFGDAVSPTATFSASGDQMTLTQTVTGS